MLRIVLLVIGVLFLVSMAVALIISALTILAMMCLVGIPLWILAKPHLQRHGMVAPKKHPIERLQALYAEGKIDMFEFERRIAKLLAVES
jgi:hypothetical protein